MRTGKTWRGAATALGALTAGCLVLLAGAGSHVRGSVQPRPQARAASVQTDAHLAGAALVRSRPTGFSRGWFVSPTTGWMVMTRGRRPGASQKPAREGSGGALDPA